MLEVPMGYFPFFVEIAGKEGLIVGGGTVALRKVEKLLPFSPRLTVVAPEILPELQALEGITLCQAPFVPDMVEGKSFVIAATDDAALNHSISALCQAKHILVNVVDDKAACSFLFPALVQQGPLTVGISTGGASPTGAIYVKELLSQALPEGFGDILEFLSQQRDHIPQGVPHGEWFSALFAACLQQGRPLQPQELEEFSQKKEAECP
jgi:siroheme synthase-like protein